MQLSYQNRLNWADCAKGLAIILVVHMHTSLGVEAATGQQSLMGLIAGYGASFRMPLFFMISGVFLAKAIELDWRSFLKKRVLQLIYLYILWTVILGLVKGLPLLGWDITQMPSYFAEALYEPKSTLWFIYVLGLFFVTAKAVRSVPAPLIIVAAVVMEIAPISTGSTVIDSYAANFVFFISGVLLAEKLKLFVAKASENVAPVTILFIVAAVLNGVFYHFGWFDAPFMHLALGLALPVVIIAFLGVITRFVSLGWLAYCGKYSIVIYLSFFIPMVIVRSILLKIGVISNVDMVSLIVFACALLSPLVVHRLIRGTSFEAVFQLPKNWRSPIRSRSVQPAE